jgi:DNA polymerase-3 subunit delta'
VARGKTPSDPSELEKIEWPYSWPPPWRNDRLVGHQQAEQTMLAAQQSGRLHHAWLLTGPQGNSGMAIRALPARRPGSGRPLWRRS